MSKLEPFHLHTAKVSLGNISDKGLPHILGGSNELNKASTAVLVGSPIQTWSSVRLGRDKLGGVGTPS
jgi:hypothetical protein